MKFPVLSKVLSKRYLAMDLEELISEHEKLVKTIESGDLDALKAELEEQKGELEHYIELSKQEVEKES